MNEELIADLKDLYIKVENTENLIKDGKVYYAVNKLEGIKQKIAYIVNRINKTIEQEKQNATDTK